MERARRLPESAASARTARLAALFAAQRESLWGLAYRLTGCADDADDVVQEAFARLLARPPDRVGEHPGPWLAAEGPDPERRYGLAESATLAFLLALEALSPRQRAVLLLRDVLGHTARETAEALGATKRTYASSTCGRGARSRATTARAASRRPRASRVTAPRRSTAVPADRAPRSAW